MDTSTQNALISGGIQLASNSMNLAGEIYKDRKNFERADTWDKTMRQRNRADTQYMWETYNSPLAQMNAYREAGLNPNLIYGQQTHTPMERSDSPAPQFNPQFPQMAAIFDAAMQSYYKAEDNRRQNEIAAANVANLKANARNTEQRTINERERNSLIQQQSVLNQLRIDYEKSTNPLRRQYLLKQINLLRENINTQVWQRGLRDRQFDLDMQRYLEQKRQFNVSDEYRKNPEYKFDPYVQQLIRLLSPNGNSQGLFQSFREHWRKWTNTNQGGADRSY